ncbi:MAG: ABC transporter permease [Acidimicrobiales bacterium]
MSRFPSPYSLVGTQVRYQTRVFWRTPVAAFFTLVLPILMLVLFNALFSDRTVETEAGSWPVRQFYTGSLAAFAAVSATFTNLANTVPILRDEGVLKRWRGTPLPPWAYVAGMVGSAVMVALIGVGIMLGLGLALYDLQIEAAKMPAAAVTFIVGVATFAALGLAVAALIPNARSASAVANAAILPLAFISNIFIPLEDPPRWLDFIGDVFPLKPFVVAFQDTFNPLTDPPAFDLAKLGWVALWGVAGAVVAVTHFRWEPSSETKNSRRAVHRRS